jgi:DNA-binding CsgD family transcriptional regulator/PAS domain-containing protein
MAIAQQLLALVPTIYDAALDPMQWGAVLGRLTDAFGGHCATIMQNWNGSEPLYITHGYDSNILHDFYGPVAAANMFVQRAENAHQGTVECDRDILPKAEFRASEFYNDFLVKHLNADAVLTGMMWRTPAGFMAFNICRDLRAKQFDHADKKNIHILMPHFARAIAIQHRLRSLESRAVTVDAILDRSPCGAIVLDAAGRIVYANRSGESLLQHGDAISVSDEGLRAATPALTARLQRILADAAKGEGGAITLAHSGGALYAIAAPFRAEFGERDAPRGRTLLMIRDPLNDPALPMEHLRDLFGLTFAEARMAALVYQGHTTAEAARLLGISKHTARVHMNALLGKTGTHRQAELMRLLMGFLPVLSVSRGCSVRPS